ncbi:hypothetical protein SISSUDRAFT_1091606 [Sistotremastrum suecicum HHB10207 ss-3]|uniref:Uncharacterized protein n=1 Tax=Sistotremastrum suecicum HHB10207 ss-3 TaxID=1314776 RepID=A0A165XZV5_9AGAM|nr:hypothetical protein SISSUDRAFT_1091606 [Sistotremastrum suecicum HHB10207 ss-3]
MERGISRKNKQGFDSHRQKLALTLTTLSLFYADQIKLNTVSATKRKLLFGPMCEESVLAGGGTVIDLHAENDPQIRRIEDRPHVQKIGWMRKMASQGEGSATSLATKLWDRTSFVPQELESSGEQSSGREREIRHLAKEWRNHEAVRTSGPDSDVFLDSGGHTRRMMDCHTTPDVGPGRSVSEKRRNGLHDFGKFARHVGDSKRPRKIGRALLRKLLDRS